jgi:hypothetical protein
MSDNTLFKGLALGSLVTMAAISSTASAARFELFDDELEMSINSKAMVGMAWRTQDRDNSIIAKRNIPGQGGSGPGNLCDDGDTSGSNDPLDVLGGCALDVAEHQAFVAAPGYFSQNNDDGNVAFDKGDIVGSVLRLTTDFGGTYGNYGFSGRFIGYYDPALDGKTRFNSDNGTALNHQPVYSEQNRGADEQLVFATAFEEAYVYGAFSMGARDLYLTFGRQPISWGETTTFPIRSVNSINPPSVTRLNSPGGDTKEIFSPTEAIHMAIGITDDISMEAWYQFKFRSIIDQLPAAGSFFSTSDVAGSGGTYAMLSFGKEPQDPDNIQDGNSNVGDPNDDVLGRGCINPNVFDGAGNLTAAYASASPTGNVDEDARTRAIVEQYGAYRAHRGGTTAGRTICRVDLDARDDGQYGVQFKAYSAALNDTEFGFYFHNTHSRLPYVNFISASESGPSSGSAITLDQQRGLSPIPLPSLLTQIGNDLPKALALADTVAIALQYPEDIKTWGLSFTTTVGDISVAGEFAYRQDDPVQIHTTDLNLYALGPAFNSLRGIAGGALTERYRARELCASRGADYDAEVAASDDGLGNTSPFTECSRLDSSTLVEGYERLDVGHGSVTILSSYSDNPFSASQWLLIVDIAATKVYGMPDKDTLHFAPNGGDDLWGGGESRTEYEANPIADPLGTGATAILGGVVQSPDREPNDTFADSFSWGFRAVSKLKYPNVLAGSSLEITQAIFMDINGNSPAPAGDFTEGRRKLFLDLNFTKGDWNLQMRHTWFTGAGTANQERDRDHAFVAWGYQF